MRMSQKRTQAVSQSRARVIDAGGTHISGVLKPGPAAALARLLASGRYGSSKNAVISAALLALDDGNTARSGQLS